jgi:hypothetical protein
MPGVLKAISSGAGGAGIGALAMAAVAGAAGTLAEETGKSYLGGFLADAIERLRKQKRLPETEDGLQQELERQLLAALEANDQQAALLRADAAAVLQRVQGVEAALEAASGGKGDAASRAAAGANAIRNQRVKANLPIAPLWVVNDHAEACPRATRSGRSGCPRPAP